MVIVFNVIVVGAEIFLSFCFNERNHFPMKLLMISLFVATAIQQLCDSLNCDGGECILTAVNHEPYVRAYCTCQIDYFIVRIENGSCNGELVVLVGSICGRK